MHWFNDLFFCVYFLASLLTEFTEACSIDINSYKTYTPIELMLLSENVVFGKDLSHYNVTIGKRNQPEISFILCAINWYNAGFQFRRWKCAFLANGASDG